MVRKRCRLYHRASRSPKRQRPSPAAYLPEELWATCIFRFLDFNDLSAASQVCSSWETLVDAEAWPHGQTHSRVVRWMQTLDSSQAVTLAERALRYHPNIRTVEALWSTVVRDCGLPSLTCADMRGLCAAAPGIAAATQGLSLLSGQSELLVECVNVCRVFTHAEHLQLREILGTSGENSWRSDVLAHPAIAIMLRALKECDRGLVALQILNRWLHAEEDVGQAPMDVPHGGCLIAFATGNVNRLENAGISLEDLRTLASFPSFVIMAFTFAFRDRWSDAVGALLQFTCRMKNQGVPGADFASTMRFLEERDTQQFSVDVVVRILQAV